MTKTLLSFQDIVELIASKYGVPFEIVESILIEWIEILHETARESTSVNDLF